MFLRLFGCEKSKGKIPSRHIFVYDTSWERRVNKVAYLLNTLSQGWFMINLVIATDICYRIIDMREDLSLLENINRTKNNNDTRRIK